MPEPIQARLTVAAPEAAHGEFMFMPAGLNVIHATKGSPGTRGREVTARVLVQRGDEAALQSQLEALNAASAHKVYFDFNHEDRDASFWPRRFSWKDAPQPGIYVAGEWSDAGRAAISGRVYRAFSPVFHVDDERKDPCRIICQPRARLNMGGLVNDPAFRNNLPLWAKHAGATQHTPTTTQSHHMTQEELAALQAKKTNLEQEIAGLVAGSTGSAEDAEAIQSKRNELAGVTREIEAAELKAQNAKLEQALLAQRTKDAEAAVKDAVRRGALPAKDTALQATWQKKCIEDPDNIALLAKVNGSPALQPAAPAPIVPRLNIQGYQVRASNENVLSEMAGICARQRAVEDYAQRPKVARELAAIYAKEILPRLKEGDDIPLKAANTLGTLATTLVAIRTLELLTQELPLLKSIATDFSDQIVSYGDSLKTRIVGIPTVQTYNTTTGWPTVSDAVTTDVTVTYNQFKGVPIQFMGHEIAGTVRRLFDELAPAQAYALGDDMVDYVFALITAANFTNTPTVAGLGTFGRSTVVDIGTTLRHRGVPAGPMNRTLILNSNYYGALGKDNAIVNLATFQRSEIIEAGVLPNVHGFRVIDCPTLPATAIGTGTLAGFAMSKSALVLATRLSADYVNAIPGAGNGNLQVVTTPAGFSANLVQFVSHTGAYAAQRLEVIYGASKGQNDAGQILATA